MVISVFYFLKYDVTLTPVDYPNPLIGTTSHLLVPCYPNINLPNGMLKLEGISHHFFFLPFFFLPFFLILSSLYFFFFFFVSILFSFHHL
jgi:hypothetical protein